MRYPFSIGSTFVFAVSYQLDHSSVHSFSGKQCEIHKLLDFSMKKACQKTSCLFNRAASVDGGRFSF